MSYLFLIFVGLVGGLVGGLFGVGGGVVFVPLLVILKKMDPHLAIGTSLAVIVPTALMAAFRNSRAGMIDWKVFPWLVVFAMIGSWLGASLSLQMGTLVLRRLYAAFLLLLSIKMFFPN